MKCAVCGRENAADAFHCYVCRSRDLGGQSPTADYRASQELSHKKQTDELLGETIENYRSFPGQTRKLELVVASIAAALFGLLAFPGQAANVLFGVSAVLFGWVALVFRISNWQNDLERKRKKKR